MFFVFGPSGQMFRGGPENLERIAGVRPVWRPQALRTRRMGLDEDGRQASLPAPTTSARPRPLGVLAAYVQDAQGPARVREPLTRVRDVMVEQAVAVAPGTRVNDAWQTLAEAGVSQAPVVNEQGRVIGLLLQADMAPLDLLPEPGAIEQAIALARRPVSEVMVSPVPAVAADTALRRVAGVLVATGLPGLPVTDEAGLLLGFIARSDILRAVAADPPLDLWSGPATPL